MDLEYKTIGMRSRLFRLRAAMRFADDPFAVALLEGVIQDIEKRIAAV